MPPTGTKPPPNKLVAVGMAVVLAGFLLPQLLPTGPAPSKPSDSPDYLGFLLKMLVGLGVVAAACVAVVRWKKPAPAVTGNMEVIATVTVGRGVVHLVRAGDRRLLVGVDLHGVKAVAELPGPPPARVVGPLRVSTGAA